MYFLILLRLFNIYPPIITNKCAIFVVRNANHIKGDSMVQKLVYGFGINDLKENKIHGHLHRRIYDSWKRMLRRCYSEMELNRKPTYVNVYVCDEWKYFSSFYDWALPRYVEGFHLDKDLIIKGNKLYSPESCCFVPVEINSFICLNNKKRGHLPIGVIFRKDTKKYASQIYIDNKNKRLGSFNTIEEAFNAYKNKKEEQAKILAERWKEYIDEVAYNALLKYEINICD